ncbi:MULTISPECIES: guanylate kinase [unclassified Tenacibaculum]|uniref:guanylate kinase n=1 Tax=unclassified Tenacibaculum TaxID=2635139 RepID=UPI001F45D911|nr:MULTISPECIES: guanylate kinase [unclassified Tenacibaculum]MCF2874491.1 guanylate kinase [Tenacibaculum sp. Cn5-1]MCF2934443.1 guanylate kinase [Tenacibaculum sp. Cn5-34]MCG7510653.1 guanylate kinase [Tenacibaculum sp. Cn5-46]
MTKEFKGKLFVFSAPSGSGKTTIVRHLLKQERFGLEFSISATSRDPRSNEVDGEDYYFISAKDFKQKIKNEEFLEWEEVYMNNFYGTLKTEIERIWALGKHVIFDIDVRGGLRIKEKFPEETLAVFVKPPDINELLRRLKSRGEESEEKIASRIAKAPIELATAPMFDKIIKNYDLKVALQEAEDLVDEFLGIDKASQKE